MSLHIGGKSQIAREDADGAQSRSVVTFARIDAVPSTHISSIKPLEEINYPLGSKVDASLRLYGENEYFVRTIEKGQTDKALRSDLDLRLRQLEGLPNAHLTIIARVRKNGQRSVESKVNYNETYRPDKWTFGI